MEWLRSMTQCSAVQLRRTGQEPVAMIDQCNSEGGRGRGREGAKERERKVVNERKRDIEGEKKGGRE
jgi:hypothetical protein